ncbi:unnamed protein product [Orchesella dallaii]|uniref:Diacylglycerol O-acyltransferase n=1 Tax=Orchesella dallaii TaxID=48710 RepID=A0ABP1RMC2_9HEXA
MSHSTSTKILKLAGKLLNKALIFSRAVLPVLFAPLIILLSVPFYILRYLLSKWAKYYSNGAIIEPVSASGNMFAPELHPSKIHRPPRCAVVTTITLKGCLTVEEVFKKVKTQWLGEYKGRPSRYPELTYYADSWFGFMFWKKDFQFKLENHIHSFKIVGKTEPEIEEEVRSLTEQLLNKPFPPRRSPWEGFVIQIDSNNGHKLKTKIVLRLHHALADGYSITAALVEGLAGVPLSEVAVNTSKSGVPKKRESLVDNLIYYGVFFPLRVCYDATSFFSWMHATKTPWHVVDEEKKWEQLYERSDVIPIENIKGIKNRFGVSFTGVLLSCVSAGISKHMNKKLKGNQKFNSISVATILPLSHHPDKLTNHLTGTAFQLPIRMDFTSEERLQTVEKLLESAKQSTLPLLQRTAALLLNTNLAAVARFCWHNRYFPVGFTNFPGSTIELAIDGVGVKDVDFAVGGQLGVLGVNFMVLSYADHIRIGVTAEKAVMNKVEVKELIGSISNEINFLYNNCAR